MDIYPRDMARLMGTGSKTFLTTSKMAKIIPSYLIN